MREICDRGIRGGDERLDDARRRRPSSMAWIICGPSTSSASFVSVSVEGRGERR